MMTSTSMPPAHSFPESYHAIRFPYDPRREGVWKAIYEYLRPWVRQDDEFLELGAGYGEFSKAVVAARKWALDQNPTLAGYWGDRVSPIIQSALDPLPLASGSLGTVFASNFFEHFGIDEGALILSEVMRTLRPGGNLIVVQPNFRLEPRRYFDDYTHRTIYTDMGFRDFLRAQGFKIARVEPRFMPFSMNSRLPTAEWLVRLYLTLPFRPMAGQFLVVAERP